MILTTITEEKNSNYRNEIFSLSVDNLVNKNAITSNLRNKLSKCVGRSVANVKFFKLFFVRFFTDF